LPRKSADHRRAIEMRLGEAAIDVAQCVRRQQPAYARAGSPRPSFLDLSGEERPLILDGALDARHVGIGKKASDEPVELVVIAKTDSAEPAFAALRLLYAQDTRASRRVNGRCVGGPQAVANTAIDIETAPSDRA